MSAAHHVITLEATLIDPALVPAAFDLLRMQARAVGLGNVGEVSIQLAFDVSGTVVDERVEELRARLEALWFGDIRDDIVTRKTETAE